MKNSRDQFYLAYTIALLVIVLAGFAPSLFMRFAFDPPPIPLYLHLHGAILTGWFVLLITQAWLIRLNNPSLHRSLGYFVAAYGLLVVAGGLMASFGAVSRDLGSGITFETDMADIDTALGAGISYLTFISGVIWANMASVLTFGALLVLAVIYRHRTDVHKRLILVATASIMGPALARISRLEFLGGEQGPFIPVALLSLLAAILIHDLFTLRRIHRASLAAIIFAIVVSVIAGSMAATEMGQAFVRDLA